MNHSYLTVRPSFLDKRRLSPKTDEAIKIVNEEKTFSPMLDLLAKKSGSLTPAGQNHYNSSHSVSINRLPQALNTVRASIKD